MTWIAQSAWNSTQPRPVAPWSPGCQRYLARQPILNAQQQTLGFELLYRDSRRNLFPGSDPDAATCNVIDFALLSDWAELTGGCPAFINCTRSILLNDAITLLPPELVVAEVLEDVPGDGDTLAACERLHRAGYTLALDDYVAAPNSLCLLPYVDIVKVDFLATSPAQQTVIAADMQRRGIRLLAEKVETEQQFLFAQRLGYEYFQGYYFSRPEPLTACHPSSTFDAAFMDAVRLADSQSFDVERLEQAILMEPSLCYRLLRYLELAHFQMSAIRSVRHALSLLGQEALRQLLQKFMLLALCCESESWQELPAILPQGQGKEADKRIRPQFAPVANDDCAWSSYVV